MQTRQPAEHRIDTCGYCGGTGKRRGPKVVLLTIEDSQRVKYLNKQLQSGVWAMATSFLLTFLFVSVMTTPVNNVSVPKIDFWIASITAWVGGILIVALPILRKKKRDAPLRAERDEILRQYGVEPDEWHILQHPEEGGEQ